MNTNQLTLPAFPLKIALLPGETTKLHIFEERYKQLVKDCIENNASFGILNIENGKLKKFGCEVRIKNVLKEFSNGNKDILIECIRIFKIVDFTEELFPKLYGAATVEFENSAIKITNASLQDAVVNYFSSIQNKLIDYETLENLTVYNVANSLQLSPQEKYELMSSSSKQTVLLNQIKFITHIVNAEQELNNRFIFN